MKRRELLGLAACGAASGATSTLAGCAWSRDDGQVFDAHCHIIDPRFPLVPNQGYTPPVFTLDDYRRRVAPLRVGAGAVVSGSFQAFDQTWLRDALARLGPRWVGVTQLPADVADAEIAALARIGVRGLRFNAFRGRIDSVDDIVSLARRVHAVAGWHAEIYADAAALRPHAAALSTLPDLVIDHLGMTENGLPVVLDLVDAGVRIKATGFGRVKMDVARALERIAARSPTALMFGTDLPSTRAERPFADDDLALLGRVLGPELARRATWDNAVAVYRPRI